MKRSWIFPLLLFFAPFAMRAQGPAQGDLPAGVTPYNCTSVEVVRQPGSADTSIVIKDTEGEQILSLSNSRDNRDDYTINIAGFELGLGMGHSPLDELNPKKKRSDNRYRGSLGQIEFGFNGLVNPDYSAYTVGEKNFLDLRSNRSTYVGLNLFNYAGSFTTDRHFGFSTALGIVWRDYAFDNPITLVKAGGLVRPVAISPSTRKSKLSTFSLSVPLLLEYRFDNRLFVAGGPYGQMMLFSHTKYKFPKIKSRGNFGLNMFEGGVTGRVGVGNFYVFGNYAFTDLFRKDRGPGTSVYTFGLGIKTK